ncbi:FtsB family cell division protein [Granulicoccus phenolivorans]|uniref:FtsB family cell division protein n=1 Tax=Granulicoccus phenolivorans TaxID=266854 RepID=UPI00040CDE9C|nr:septum formation initiator family protein [Granulicoccus phenolivorans]
MAPPTVHDADQVATADDPAPTRGLRVTRRALALLIVLAVVAVSFGNSLRVYFETEQRSAANRERIAASEQRIGELQDDLSRWDDPQYVRAQAHTRLGWVMPGEVGYRVVGADGKPIGNTIQTQRDDKPGVAANQERPWWQKIWESVKVADGTGTPGPTPEAAKPPLTDGTNTPTPRTSPTPTATPTPSKSASKTPTKSPSVTKSPTKSTR